MAQNRSAASKEKNVWSVGNQKIESFGIKSSRTNPLHHKKQCSEIDLPPKS